MNVDSENLNRSEDRDEKHSAVDVFLEQLYWDIIETHTFMGRKMWWSGKGIEKEWASEFGEEQEENGVLEA